MTSFPRFDLHESSYAIALMSNKTPAWREAYAEILDQLVDRYRTHWSAIDWNTQFGEDPDKASYPPHFARLIPKELWGEYETPGWTANGNDPRYPVQLDPLGADAMLFFKGWFNLVLGIHAYVSGSSKWENTWTMCGVDDHLFPWKHSKLALTLEQKFLANDGQGLH